MSGDWPGGWYGDGDGDGDLFGDHKPPRGGSSVKNAESGAMESGRKRGTASRGDMQHNQQRGAAQSGSSQNGPDPKRLASSNPSKTMQMMQEQDQLQAASAHRSVQVTQPRDRAPLSEERLQTESRAIITPVGKGGTSVYGNKAVMGLMAGISSNPRAPVRSGGGNGSARATLTTGVCPRLDPPQTHTRRPPCRSNPAPPPAPSAVAPSVRATLATAA
eukprot:CAMPEP_0173324184 /NCGR_PEP_ID=MMETSP1143-20121109/30917_1 /TAXON_ID=483371 /ORGANISM="non described non described, Strain CCMP2298" /LENGTH=217 /DNA_ID=CAMNT_0014268203 /DNA_START=145 /DNA_END=795 /DNA_ORIENTATION=+